MACCGKTIRDRPQSGVEIVTGSVAEHEARSGASVFFKYLGRTAISVVGPVTGRRYQLAGHAATAAVDPRDAPSVAAVPHLVRVTHP
jgi:hypothetical protein